MTKQEFIKRVEEKLTASRNAKRRASRRCRDGARIYKVMQRKAKLKLKGKKHAKS